MSSSNKDIVKGTRRNLPVTLTKGGVSFNIPTGTATVTATFITRDRKRQLLATQTLSSAAPGADWTQSLVVVELTAIETESLPPGPATLEVRVADPADEDLNFYVNVNIAESTLT